MNKISMSMSKEEMFTLIQSLKPIERIHTIKSIQNVIDIARNDIPDNETECLYIAILNDNGVLIDSILINTYANNTMNIDLIKILRKVISIPGANGLIVVHNHPFSSNVKPSKMDLKYSLHMATVFQFLGLVPIDFVIINHTDYYSFRESRQSIFNYAKAKVKKLMNK